MTHRRIGAGIVGLLLSALMFALPSTGNAQTTTTPVAPVKNFRLLAPSTKFDGKTRSDLLILGYEAKVRGDKGGHQRVELCRASAVR